MYKKKYIKYKYKYLYLKKLNGGSKKILYIGCDDTYTKDEINKISITLGIEQSDIDDGIYYDNIISYTNTSDDTYYAIFISHNDDIFTDEILQKLIRNSSNVYFFNSTTKKIHQFDIYTRILFLLSIIKRYFPNNNITYEYINNPIDIGIEYIIECSTDHLENSKLKICDDHITLSGLSKCGNTKGSEILEKIKLIGLELKDKNIKYINLSDKSEIFYINWKCRYSLASFYILLNGESWYNSFGFLSETYVDEFKYNDKIRNLSFNKFIEMFKSKHLNFYISDYDNIDVFSSRFLEINSEINSEMPINQIVGIIDTYIKGLDPAEKIKCTVKIRLFAIFINCSKFLLNYDHNLKFLLN